MSTQVKPHLLCALAIATPLWAMAAEPATTDKAPAESAPATYLAKTDLAKNELARNDLTPRPFIAPAPAPTRQTTPAILTLSQP